MDEKLKTIAKEIVPRVSNEIVNEKLVITLSGTVGEPYWYEDDENFINEKRVKELVGDSKRDVVIKLNSPGGDVFEGIATYNYLKNLDNHVTVEVTALAASAASIIAMAGDEIVMCTGSQMMIHEASTFTFGNKSDHQRAINTLGTVDDSIISVYAERSGIDRETITEWLNGETWFTAEKAVEQGLADRTQVATEEDDETDKADETEVNNSFNIEEITAKIKADLEAEYGLLAKKETEQQKPKNIFYKGAK